MSKSRSSAKRFTPVSKPKPAMTSGMFSSGGSQKRDPSKANSGLLKYAHHGASKPHPVGKAKKG